ncbi:hypothetical protein PIB30_047302 [Stylosanthes scabra]|uniref:Uncharacterized protein n=1 Tax=Stylosanthes scabra TaxID=79078 RepID=A0ABU6XH00_9FABA|nr:hypothetical protein [Stylosanthes scabra]
MDLDKTDVACLSLPRITPLCHVIRGASVSTLLLSIVPPRPNKADQIHNSNTECGTKEAGDKDKQVEERVQEKVPLLEITNTDHGKGEEKPRNKTWKRQARQAAITHSKRKENEEQGGVKRKAQDCEDMEIDNSELKMGKVSTATINRTAEAAKQRCRDQ